MIMTANRIAAAMALVLSSAVFAAEPVPSDAQAEQPRATTAPAATQSTKQQQPTAKPQSAAPAVSAAQSANPRASSDRLDLDTTVVTGNRELPKVLYIVPWKKADLGDLPAQPFNTLLDEVLTPVDRDVFRREVTYYDAVSSGGNTAGAAPAAAEPGEPAK